VRIGSDGLAKDPCRLFLDAADTHTAREILQERYRPRVCALECCSRAGDRAPNLPQGHVARMVEAMSGL